MNSTNQPKIRVIVRKRPLSRKELQRNDSDIIDIRGTNKLVVRETKLKIKIFNFIINFIL